MATTGQLSAVRGTKYSTPSVGIRLQPFGLFEALFFGQDASFTQSPCRFAFASVSVYY